MNPNTSLTIYAKSINPTTRTEIWTPSQVVGVFWDDSRAANVIKSGMMEADKVTVYIFDISISIKIGDVIVRGLVSDIVDGTFTMADLRAKYPRSAVVSSVDTMDRGSKNLQHLQVGGK